MNDNVMKLLKDCSAKYKNGIGDIHEDCNVFRHVVKDLLKQAKTPDDYYDYTSIKSMKAHFYGRAFLMPHKLQKWYSCKIEKSVPGDLVEFKNEEEVNDLKSLYIPPTYKGYGTPIDIIKAGTIPLMDVVIRLPQSELSLGSDFRVVIFPDYKERLEKAKDIDTPIIGAYVIYSDKPKASKRQFVGLLQILPGTDYIIDSGLIGWLGEPPDKHLKALFNSVSMGTSAINTLTRPYLMAWYCIQLTLLNPPTREIYYELREKATSVKTSTCYNGKRNKIKYVKRIYLNPNENFIPKAEKNTAGTKHKIKCPYWRVIGHWREYKDGSRTFINGYWKGPNRNFIPKNAMDSVRERVITTKDKGGGKDG